MILAPPDEVKGRDRDVDGDDDTADEAAHDDRHQGPGRHHEPAAVRAVLLRPGPQPCNQIPSTYVEALAALGVRRSRRRWRRLKLLLRIGRMLRRLIRHVVRPEVEDLARELVALRTEVAALRRQKMRGAA